MRFYNPISKWLPDLSSQTLSPHIWPLVQSRSASVIDRTRLLTPFAQKLDMEIPFFIPIAHAITNILDRSPNDTNVKQGRRLIKVQPFHYSQVCAHKQIFCRLWVDKIITLSAHHLPLFRTTYRPLTGSNIPTRMRKNNRKISRTWWTKKSSAWCWSVFSGMGFRALALRSVLILTQSTWHNA